MIRATLADRAEVAGFLRRHLPIAMFPLANLHRHGMAGGHPRAMSFWLCKDRGAITDIAAISDGGSLFPVCPTHPWADLRAAMQGSAVCAILGDAAQVTGLRAALGLEQAAGYATTEPHYDLPLTDLVMPDTDGFTLRPLVDAPRDLVIGWRRAYLSETMLGQENDMDATAIKDIDSYLAVDSHRVLFDGDTPVAMTGFNAVLHDAVQIGGVYTPPGLRSRGLARRAVALHLAQARAVGVSRAILFAASAAASTAYQAIGFRRIGAFAIVLHAEPQVVHG
ncbi:GNAT family N-acetyltransferase [Yoonia sp. TsM2_T14_4]|uniref:GNAT family N-acetyltransferase n=1 Tax=Yoonia sp. TsM2_T14_4 TaxID=3415141 RepID=UPI003C7456DF